ncbi:acetyltransferase [Methylopila jiangsuensis]|uniref:Acetyltransferase n=1 Tax=Methylopila jiangsuensis TaxID=586230 RepID=A0A9W6JHK9_9HYPH|nr:GNAT family N-acetyltransferase [Methylopila jiangsuensis]MDR6286144.1 GNAT superfamily N-acetyltransferase [Methylopila jiangsuensis]GLK75904.1 acetyltransferase [Methylopila jiangsuensis]
MMDGDVALALRRAGLDDGDAVWDVIRPALRAGETYALPRDISKADALALWLAADRETWLAEDQEGRTLGVYYLKANQGGGGSHVANCGYMTAVEAAGRGVARAMCAHSLERAGGRGFRAMQFNFVVSTNERAVRLWRAFGFETVGVLPDAFEHPRLGVVDALVMHRRL